MQHDDFLRSLDERLFYISKTTDRLGTRRFPLTTEDTMTLKETQIVLGIIAKGSSYAMTPGSVNYGFRPACTVLRVDSHAPGMHQAVRMLTFAEKQSPVDWELLSEHYMATRNLELLSLVDMEKPEAGRERYEY
jgi:hypothetical protein